LVENAIPSPVVAYFERVVAVSFAFPEDLLQPLMVDGVNGSCSIRSRDWVFVTVALVWTKGLRPAGFPGKVLGTGFFSR